jgi:hypothetical protein
MIHIGTPPVIEACTGVLVKPDVVVTSYHCMQASNEFSSNTESPDHACYGGKSRRCRDIAIEFDFLDRREIGITAQCQDAVAYDKVQDFVALKIHPEEASIGRSPRAPAVTPSAADAPPDRLVIIHHPLGFPLVAEDTCKFRGADRSEIQHNCDTQSGSSGAPIFDSQMAWIGSHFQGPYPADWSGAQIEEYLKLALRGERPLPVSHARSAAAILKCVEEN